MGKSLIIVESPAKAKTIKKYLGPDYIVKASVGHVKDLPERRLSIGRPSTYAAILSTLRDRQYAQDQARKLTPTELGKTVNVLLVESFPDILDAQFTAQLEDKLDKIEKGQYQWVDTLLSFYEPFAAEVTNNVTQTPPVEATCDKRQRPVPKPCPRCQTPYLPEKRASTKQGQPPVLQCPSQACKYSETVDEMPETLSVA